ncbi:hypothetical protein [Rhizobium sp. RCAM05973]|uniref:hypothetical protein n=1 Tax=Rhizobium sp. RCAM05973 TaxID=2994066 RepID=UPI0022EBC395|nr:hypothetical protein [Rhizobium sp. RCAM05973]
MSVDGCSRLLEHQLFTEARVFPEPSHRLLRHRPGSKGGDSAIQIVSSPLRVTARRVELATFLTLRIG